MSLPYPGLVELTAVLALLAGPTIPGTTPPSDVPPSSPAASATTASPHSSMEPPASTAPTTEDASAPASSPRQDDADPLALTITAPTAANLGTVAIGGVLSTHLGEVSATGMPPGDTDWVATVTATAFTTTGGTIPTSAISYWSGPATHSMPVNTCTPGQPTAAQAVILTAPRVAFSHPSMSGRNECRWNPTIVISVPATAVAGIYTGTITHSIA